MSENEKQGKELCCLNAHQGIEAWCTREKCVFWRLLDAQDVHISNEQGCGLEHFDVLKDLEPKKAAWLRRIKQRLEDTRPDEEKSRINFRHIE